MTSTVKITLKPVTATTANLAVRKLREVEAVQIVQRAVTRWLYTSEAA